MIIDSHVHFYEHPQPDAVHTGTGDHLPFAEVLAQAREVGIDRVAQVTPVAMGYDNRYSFAMAELHPHDIAGVMARIDMLADEVRDKAQELLSHPQLLAVRITLIDRENEGWLAARTLDPFFAIAQDLGLPIELFAPFRVAEMHATVNRFPGIRWLIDHLGLRYYAGRDNRDAFRQWPDLLHLAAEPNAWIKCSYFPEAAKDIEGYPYPTAQQRLRELYEHVGADRLVWGSNFPNVRRACTYRQALDFVRTECAFLGAAERNAMLGGNLLRYASRASAAPTAVSQ